MNQWAQEEKEGYKRSSGASRNTKNSLERLSGIIGIAVYALQIKSAWSNRANEKAFSSGENKSLLFTTLLASSLIGFYLGSQRQIILKYIDDIYQCMPVLNRYRQRHEVMN